MSKRKKKLSYFILRIRYNPIVACTLYLLNNLTEMRKKAYLTHHSSVSGRAWGVALFLCVLA